MAVKYPQMRTAAQDFATQTHVVTVEMMNRHSYAHLDQQNRIQLNSQTPRIYSKPLLE